MKKKRTLGSLNAVASILVVVSLIFNFLLEKDAYRYFNGLDSQFDLSPDDQNILFSYFTGGDEAIYESNSDGKNVRKLAESETERLHDPRYSSDGKKLLYLSQNSQQLNSLVVADRDGSNPNTLTTKKLHVSEAVFSKSGQTIYFIAIPAKDYKKAEGETKEGADLYSISVKGGKPKQLTNLDHFSMNSLSLSPNGKDVYYALDDTSRAKLTSFSIEKNAEVDVNIPSGMPSEAYSIRMSPNGENIAYTAIAKESRNSSLYEYELFLMDMATGKTKRMTDLNTSVGNPKFFHGKNQIAFLEQTNWADTPEKYDFFIQDLDSKKLKPIAFSIPGQKPIPWFLYGMSQLANGTTAAVLYLLLVCFITTYLYLYHPKRTYLPAKVNFGLGIIGVVSSFIVALISNPWFGIAIGGVSAFIMGAAILAFAFAYLLKRIGERKRK
ncbi:DPP IV N-terminal domain-containing protein [Neobacillus terrae]|uniref:DPP IV N-terminal domain-containing protein n=1 Tax=Neobacillus terrae TaxID=3034837 RepID=UPI0014075A20|nr:DPP IV N-terminal domain-containing protein [Neobacillus terrae]NHM31480.1 DUF5050 domain-containing protein [Neobacillus terrae]